MNIFKKKTFLDRNSALDIAELIANILLILVKDGNDSSCYVSRRITLIVLISDILVYQRDNENVHLTEKNFEDILELEYLNNLANNKKIKNVELHTRLRQYLVNIPQNMTQDTKMFEQSETSKEQHNFITGEIKKIIPVLKLLNSRDY